MSLKLYRVVVSVVFSVFLAGLLVGCGGGQGEEAPEGDAGGGQGESGTATGGEGGGGEGGGGEGPELETANGVVQFANAESRRVFLIPEEEGGEPRAFIVGQNARVLLDGEEAELGDVERGQRAQIRFSVNEEIETPNVARSIAVVNVEGGGGETTGGG